MSPRSGNEGVTVVDIAIFTYLATFPRLCQKLNSPHGSVEMFQIISRRPTLDPLPRAVRAGGNESCFSVERI